MTAATSAAAVDIVCPMSGTDDPGTGPDSDPWAVQSGRAWRHPSELGQMTRGHSDRRRTTVIAGAVLLGGVCILLSGFAMGGTGRSAGRASVTLPSDRGLSALALVSAVEDGVTHPGTGVVLDAEGHVLVARSAVASADEIWARCSDGDLQPARLVATDDASDLAVIRLNTPGGSPVSISRRRPPPGTRLQLVRAGAASNFAAELSAGHGVAPSALSSTLISFTIRSEPATFSATPVDPGTLGDPDGSMVFDDSGRLAGMVTSDGGRSSMEPLEILPGFDISEVAQRLIERSN